MLRGRDCGATTIEWVVLAMVLGVGGIALWRGFASRVAGTVARGGDCVLALDGSCSGGSAAAALAAAPGLQAAGATATTGSAPAMPGVVATGSSLPVGASVGSSSLTWGAPGFTQGWTPQAREQYLAEHGVADPDVYYFTPFWEHGPPNYYTGTPDTGGTNTFGVIHDYNIGHDDWSWLGDYFDVVTPLTGRTHTDIDNAAARLGHAVGRALGLPPSAPR